MRYIYGSDFQYFYPLLVLLAHLKMVMTWEEFKFYVIILNIESYHESYSNIYGKEENTTL